MTNLLKKSLYFFLKLSTAKKWLRCSRADLGYLSLCKLTLASFPSHACSSIFLSSIMGSCNAAVIQSYMFNQEANGEKEGYQTYNLSLMVVKICFQSQPLTNPTQANDCFGFFHFSMYESQNKLDLYLCFAFLETPGT